MSFFFYVFLFSLMTAIGTAPVVMIFERIVSKQILSFEHALKVCFYPALAIWFSSNMAILYFGDKAIGISFGIGSVSGALVYALMLVRSLGYSWRRGAVIGIALSLITDLVALIGGGVVVLFMLVYDAILR